MRTVVTFQSSAFNTTEPRDHFINPGSFGDDAARWLGAALRASGLRADEEPGQEDFGWCIEFDVLEGRHCCVIGFRKEDDPADSVWIAWIERSRGILGSLAGLRRSGIAPSAVDALHQVLTGAPEIRNVRWHREDDFDAGREDAGAPPPEAA